MILNLGEHVAATLHHTSHPDKSNISYKSKDPEFRKTVETILLNLHEIGDRIREYEHNISQAEKQRIKEEVEEDLLAAFSAFKAK